MLTYCQITLRSSGAQGLDVFPFYRYIAPLERKTYVAPVGLKNESGKGRKSESEKSDNYILLSLPSFPLFALLGLMKHNT